MTLTLRPILQDAGIDLTDALVIRHAYVKDQNYGLHADSTDAEILAFTQRQEVNPLRFPAKPPGIWVVCLPEGGDRARLWAVLENRGELRRDDYLRDFDLVDTDKMADLRNRLVISWKAPRAWWVWADTAGNYSVLEIANAKPVPFPGFDHLILEYPQLQAMTREQRYHHWRTALSSVKGIYLITDLSDGLHYVGKADGEENIFQRWATYAANGHGGNVKLYPRNPDNFRFSLLRVFDPATPQSVVDTAESHFKKALDSINHGLNAN